jgi:branched-chain amino acid transport system substrate-binding protein
VSFLKWCLGGQWKSGKPVSVRPGRIRHRGRSAASREVVLLTVTALTAALVACGSGTNSSSGAPVVAGFLGGYTGPFAANDLAIKNGWLLGQKIFGDTASGRKIEADFVDDQNDLNTTITQARQLVELQNVNVLEAPTASNLAAAVETYAGPKGIPIDDVSLCSQAQLQIYKQYSTAWAGSWTCDQPSLMMGQYAYQTLGYRHVTTIGLDYAYGWTAVGGFVSSFEKAGGTIDKLLWAPTTTADWSPYVTQIGKTDAVFALLGGSAAISFTKAYQGFGLLGKIPLIGNTTLTDESLLPTMDPKSLVGVTVAAQYCDGLNTPANNEFVAKWFAAYGNYPGYYAENGYTRYERLYVALKQLNGKPDAKALANAMKSATITFPRGPVTLSTVTSSPIQDIYICQVQSTPTGLRDFPIYTYKAVQPWGPLTQAEWQKHFERDSAARPTA